MTDRYRKKPVEIRAWNIGFDGQPDWVREAFDCGRIEWCPAGEGVYINTLEGRMKANIGDMLIEGVKGELYGCRADIFAATYEPMGVPSDDVQLDAAKSTAAIAWGWLWHVTTADDRVITARRLLGQMLDKDLKRYGIQNAKDGGARVNVQEIEAAMLRGEFGDPLER